jgi:hypothetical protein
MAQHPADQRRSGRRLLIGGVAIVLVAVGSLIFLTADAGDGSSPPDVTPTASQPTAAPGSGGSASPSSEQAPTPGVGPGSSGPPAPAPPATPTDDPAGAAPASDQSLIGQITALIGALTGLILAATGLIRILRTRDTSPE